jgi:hypothetical protein
VKATGDPRRSLGHQIIALLEDELCFQWQALRLVMVAGGDSVAQEAAIAELYRTLQLAQHFQAHPANWPSTWLSRLQ